MRAKIKLNVSENAIFQFLKYSDSVMCTLHLLCVLISEMWVRKLFLTKICRIFLNLLRKLYLPKEKKSIHGSFLHVLINLFQESLASLNEDIITVLIYKCIPEALW